MNQPIARSVLIAVLLFVASACTVMDMESLENEDEAFGQPKPIFPESEFNKGREGWVMVGYEVAPSGLVTYVGVLDSSGNEAFERAATDALAKWRFAPGDERQQTGLINFEFDQTIVRLSRRFTSLNRRAHEYIEAGDLDAAEETLGKIRSYDDLGVYDLAYSYLTEGRIAGARGDHAGQLRLFRKAVQNDGRWLDRKHYLAALRAIVIMEIEQQDYASAVRDYELLAETSVGRDVGGDLAELVQSIDEQLQEKGITAAPYMASNISVTVERYRLTERDPIKERPSDADRGAHPPMKPPRKSN
ncbi:MAG: energy transducer TonB [Woeseiaceae bacterium]|nr:energy transducer TonB [Woeseiaceae bacterium]